LVGLGLWIFIGANGPLSLFALSVLVVFLGISLTKERFASVGREVDVSYGLYLYHFPIIQTVLVSSTFVWSSTLSYTLLPVLALVISGSIAYTSWRFVEKPSIDRARANTISN
jgi:peptidoglycan/LPS O-acetylase OafA/YrhL